MNSGQRAVKPKHRLLHAVFRRRKLLSGLLDGLDLFMRGAGIPFLGRFHPFVRLKNNFFVNLPVNVGISAAAVPLPPVVVETLIKRSRYIHILNKCMCRHGRDCKNHDQDIGCLFLGASGLDIVPQFSRAVSVGEALSHVERGLENGLLPTAGRFRVDNYAFLTPDCHTMIGICFCCSCCCFLRSYRNTPQALLAAVNPGLKGLEIEVTSKCRGCGICMQTCYMGAISIKNAKALHADKCLGCGRCAKNCPHGAVEIRLTNPSYFGETIKKFLSLADID